MTNAASLVIRGSARPGWRSGIALALLVAGCGPTTTSTPSAETSTPSPPTWRYGESRDEMRGAITTTATLESTDTFANDVLTRDRAPTELEIQRVHGRQSVSITNPNLQFTCHALMETRVAVKFDDGKVEHYPCVEEATDQYGVAFIRNEDRFVRRLKAAKKVIIEAEVFQRGDVQMHFENPGLDWPKSGK